VIRITQENPPPAPRRTFPSAIIAIALIEAGRPGLLLIQGFREDMNGQ
jgi:hypothetical protein